MSTRKWHGLVKFCRQLVAAMMVVTAMAFIGVAIEHSPASQAIAPHETGTDKAHIIERGGHTFAEIKTPNGELLRQLPAGLSGPGQRRRGGSGSPPNWQLWRSVVLIIVLIALIAAATAGLDQVRRSSRRSPIRPSLKDRSRGYAGWMYAPATCWRWQKEPSRRPSASDDHLEMQIRSGWRPLRGLDTRRII